MRERARGFQYPVVEGPEIDIAHAAFANYVLPEVEVLARVALSITRNSADAEDLVQETLLNAFRAIDRFDGRYPRAWLLTILRNTEAKRHRRRRPQLLHDADQAEREAQVEPSLDSEAPDAIVIGKEFDTVVGECLSMIPEDHRAVVELVDIDGLSYAEAAEALGVPVGTIMSRLHRARARMRQRLTAAGLAPKRSM